MTKEQEFDPSGGVEWADLRTTASRWMYERDNALAEVARLTAERDRLQVECDDYWRRFNSSQHSNKTLAAMAREYYDEREILVAERDKLQAALKLAIETVERRGAMYDALVVQMAKYQEVVEKARAWRTGWSPEWITAMTSDGRRDMSKSRTYVLIAAIDALDDES